MHFLSIHIIRIKSVHLHQFSSAVSLLTHRYYTRARTYIDPLYTHSHTMSLAIQIVSQRYRDLDFFPVLLIAPPHRSIYGVRVAKGDNIYYNDHGARIFFSTSEFVHSILGT